MSIIRYFLKEYKQESAVTRRFIEALPYDQWDYRPDEKSRTLGGLIHHMTELSGWWKSVLELDSINYIDYTPKVITSQAELLEWHDGLHSEAVETLSTAKDAVLDRNWTFYYGDHVVFSLPKRQVLRSFCMNHIIHHRGQLSTYYRALGVAVPAIYGPSADDNAVITTRLYDI